MKKIYFYAKDFKLADVMALSDKAQIRRSDNWLEIDDSDSMNPAINPTCYFYNLNNVLLVKVVKDNENV